MLNSVIGQVNPDVKRIKPEITQNRRGHNELGRDDTFEGGKSSMFYLSRLLGNRILAALVLLLLSCIRASGQTPERTPNGEQVLRAFQSSFPHRVSEVAFVDDDWTITAGGQIFYWAEGRLLSKAARKNVKLFDPHSFYHYPAKPRSPDTFTPQLIEGLRNRAKPQNRLAYRVSYALHGVLYGGLTRTEVQNMLENVVFLGKRIIVHRMIVEPLRNVEAEIMKWEGAEAFIASLDSAHGYSWREIAGTRRMSYHSWGIAVDIQPKKLNEQAIYWLWEWHRNKNWMLIPLEKRWNPPDPVIEAFERQGFIWGGKWLLFDNMHFEYRPELIEFNRRQGHGEQHDGHIQQP